MKRVYFSILLLSALMTLLISISAPAFGIKLAGSMKWFEQETSLVCRSSPANRLTRTPVCLGFEVKTVILASR